MMVVFLAVRTFLVKAGDIAVSGLVTDLGGDSAGSLQRVGFLAAVVHGDDLMRPRSGERSEVGRYARIGRIGHCACQRIGGEEIERSILGLQLRMTGGQPFGCILIDRHLVVKTTFQFGAHSRQFLGVRRYILESGSSRPYGREIDHPCRAAQLSAARSCSADTPCLLACTDLLHLHADTEGLGIDLD